MQNHKNILQMIVLSLLISMVYNLCPANLNIEGIQAGTFQLNDLQSQNDSKSNDVISFNKYTLLLKVPSKNAQIILAISQFDIQNSAIDLFDLNIIEKNQNSFTLGFLYEPLKWKKVSYRYWVSSRPEFQFFMITISSESFKYNSDKTIRASAQLQRPLQNVENYEALSFIKGLKYQNKVSSDHSISISILNYKLSTNSIIFSLSQNLNSEGAKLQLLSVSYLLFQPSRIQFASYAGLIQKTNYVGKSRYDILHIDLPTLYYSFYGLTSFEFTSKSLTMTTAISEQLYLTSQTSLLVNKLVFQYFVIAIKANQVCRHCGQQNIVSNKNCVKSCSSNEIIFKFKDGSLACLKCKENQIIDSINNKCLTKGQQTNSTIQGINYDTTQSYSPSLIMNNNQNNKQKQLSSNHSGQNSKNQKNANSNIELSAQSYVPQNNIDVNLYDPNQNFNPYTNSVYQSSVSESQMSTMFYPQVPLNAQSYQPQMQTQSHSTIQQKPATYKYSPDIKSFTYCGTLPNSYWTGGTCQCKVGFRFHQFQCIRINSFLTHHKNKRVEDLKNTTIQTNDSIIYRQQQVQTVNSKQTISNRNGQRSLNQSHNQQQNRTQNSNNQLTTKNSNISTSIAIQKIKPLCILQNEVLDKDNLTCRCLSGFGYMMDSKNESKKQCVICELFEGHYLRGQNCVSCGMNQVYNQFTSVCKCKEGFGYDDGNNCVLKQFQRRDFSNNNPTQQNEERSRFNRERNQQNSTSTNTQLERNDSKSQTSTQNSNISSQNNNTQNSSIQNSNSNETTSINYPNVQLPTNIPPVERPNRIRRQNQFNRVPVQTTTVTNSSRIENKTSNSNGQQNSTNYNSNNVSTARANNSNPIQNVNQEANDGRSNPNPAQNKTLPQINKTTQSLQKKNNSQNANINNTRQNKNSSEQNTIESQNRTQSSQNTTNSSQKNQQNKNSSLTTVQNDCMKTGYTPQINPAGVYVSLVLNKSLKFKSQNEMKNFMKMKVDQDSTKPSSVYCNQDESVPQNFECLLLYPTGLPTKDYQVLFWYEDKQASTQCNLRVKVSPLQSLSKAQRSLRRN